MSVVASGRTMDSLEEYRQRFEPLLQQTLDERLAGCRVLLLDDTLFSFLSHARDLTVHGGKRLRPYLVWIGARAFGGDETAALRAGVGLELFHAFALIHDDVMDRGVRRHGMETTHRHVTQILKDQQRMGELEHVGESQAVLVGDLFFTWAAALLPSPLFFTMADEVILGQMIDVDLTTRTEAPTELIDRKMLLKTASYSFVRPLQMGASLGGASANDLQILETIGKPLGLAFQIQDDLLDLTVPPKELKKTAFSDLTERQHTILTDYISKQGTQDQKNELARLFGVTLTEEDRSRIIDLFTASGAIAHAQGRMRKYYDEAREHITASMLPERTRKELEALVAFLQDRTS